MSEVFQQNSIVKWVIFFARLSSWKSEINKLQMWGFESFIYLSKFWFFGTVLEGLIQWSLKMFLRRPTMVGDIFTQHTPPP